MYLQDYQISQENEPETESRTFEENTQRKNAPQCKNSLLMARHQERGPPPPQKKNRPVIPVSVCIFPGNTGTSDPRQKHRGFETTRRDKKAWILTWTATGVEASAAAWSGRRCRRHHHHRRKAKTTRTRTKMASAAMAAATNTRGGAAMEKERERGSGKGTKMAASPSPSPFLRCTRARV
jgi:hypothetical protein